METLGLFLRQCLAMRSLNDHSLSVILSNKSECSMQRAVGLAVDLDSHTSAFLEDDHYCSGFSRRSWCLLLYFVTRDISETCAQRLSFIKLMMFSAWQSVINGTSSVSPFLWGPGGETYNDSQDILVPLLDLCYDFDHFYPFLIALAPSVPVSTLKNTHHRH